MHFAANAYILTVWGRISRVLICVLPNLSRLAVSSGVSGFYYLCVCFITKINVDDDVEDDVNYYYTK